MSQEDYSFFMQLPVTKVITSESYLNKLQKECPDITFNYSWFCEAGASGSTTKNLNLRGCPLPHFQETIMMSMFKVTDFLCLKVSSVEIDGRLQVRFCCHLSLLTYS